MSEVKTDSVVNVSGDNDSGIDLSTNDVVAIKTADTERARVDASGNVLVGTTTNVGLGNSSSPEGILLSSSQAQIVVASSADTPLYLNRQTNDGEIIQFRKDGSATGRIRTEQGIIQIGSGATGLDFEDSNDAIRPINTTNGNARDNAIDLGRPDVRFDDIYATNGTIQTSDQNEKNTITDSDLGLDFINRLSPKSYIFNNKTRTHYGMIAQDVETVLTDIGKTGTDFAGFIKADVSDAQDGSAYKYGLRYTEFVSPLIQAVKDLKTQLDAEKAKVSALEARVTALEDA